MIRKSSRSRRGAAAAELAVLLPFLAFLFVIAVDWARIFYYPLVVDNCARNGAVYASDSYAPIKSPYATLQDAAQADAPNLSPKPTVTSVSGVDASGNKYVDCTVSYAFSTFSNFPGVPKSNTIVRTVRVYQAPQAPN
jgi:Flp pilus assembly protein TadG